MARKSVGPWFWEAKNGWFVHLNGKRINLRVKGSENETEAVKAWHRLMADGPKAPVKEEPKPEVTVKTVFDAFLADAKGRVKANTYATYDGLLKAVNEAHGGMRAEGFTVAVALAFANRPRKPAWSSSHRHNLLGAVATAFKWAAAVGLITDNPLKAMKRPPKASRGAKAVVSQDAHAKLMDAANPALRVLLTLLHATGCRPSELAKLTAADVDFPNAVAILQDHKTAGTTGKPRVVILTPKAVEVLREQAAVNLTGPLLRNARGGKWTKDGIGLAMRRASKAAGVKGIAYGYRHGFATDALAAGVPDAHVAELLGHSGTAMLHRHYSHLGGRARTLRQALENVRPVEAADPAPTDAGA
ncbi:MAG: site-specific integrase [Bacteroidales bacterium]|nr:site-specific integrase [Bacteroidales bacterium]